VVDDTGRGLSIRPDLANRKLVLIFFPTPGRSAAKRSTRHTSSCVKVVRVAAGGSRVIFGSETRGPRAAAIALSTALFSRRHPTLEIPKPVWPVDT